MWQSGRHWFDMPLRTYDIIAMLTHWSHLLTITIKLLLEWFGPVVPTLQLPRCTGWMEIGAKSPFSFEKSLREINWDMVIYLQCLEWTGWRTHWGHRDGNHSNIFIFIFYHTITAMMTSVNGNIFRVTGHLCGEFTVNCPHKGQWRRALMFCLIGVWIYGWVNSGEAGDLRRYRAHYDVTVMKLALQYRSRKCMSLCNLNWLDLI